MTQIAFLTAFLGLIAGQQPVTVSVTGPAARVELLLDQRVVAALAGTPWTASVDFGAFPMPHRLEARAYDKDGAVVASASQKINFAPAGRDLRLVLDDKQRRARIVWSAVDVSKPDFIEARLDGKPVRIDDNAIALPAPDGRMHLVEASVRIRREEMEAQLVFGDVLQATTSAALTAVPVHVDGERVPIEAIQAKAGTTPLRVVAIDDLPGEVMVVREGTPTEATTHLEATSGRRSDAATITMAMPGTGRNIESNYSLGPADRVRFLWPNAQSGAGTSPSILFAPSRSYAAAPPTDVRMLLTHLALPEPSAQTRYSDAVAVAGLQIAQSQRPRAVVLVLGSRYDDKSRLHPAEVRAYLARIGVPLFVWSVGDSPSPAAQEWGNVVDVSALPKLAAAVHALRRSLDGQRVLWVEGDYLPSEVSVTGTGVESLVR